MGRDALIASCAALSAPSPEHLEAYAQRGEAMASVVSLRLLERADFRQLIGADNEGVMRSNHRNHAKFIGSFLTGFAPDLFVDTVHWVYRTYRAHGFDPRYWAVMVPLWQQVMQQTLPTPAAEAIAPFYSWLADNHEAFVALSDAHGSPWEDAGLLGPPYDGGAG